MFDLLNIKPGDTIPEITGNFSLDSLRFNSFMGRLGVNFTTALKDFSLNRLEVTSLEGCPQEVGGVFRLYRMNCISSLEGSPARVGGIYIDECDQLTSLEGCPKNITTDVVIRSCDKLKNFKGLPEKIYGSLGIIWMDVMCGLEGLPKYVAGDFTFTNNVFPQGSSISKIDEWMGSFPRKIGGNLYIYGCIWGRRSISFYESDIKEAGIEVGGRVIQHAL